MQGDLKGAVANNERIKVAVLGASGYTGAEVIRLGANHPHMEITQLTAERAAGKKFEDVFPSLAPAAAGTMVKIADVDFDAIDAVFCCLPHATTQEVRQPNPHCIPQSPSLNHLPRSRSSACLPKSPFHPIECSASRGLCVQTSKHHMVDSPSDYLHAPALSARVTYIRCI